MACMPLLQYAPAADASREGEARLFHVKCKIDKSPRKDIQRHGKENPSKAWGSAIPVLWRKRHKQ
jgi:hypothetical protein